VRRLALALALAAAAGASSCGEAPAPRGGRAVSDALGHPVSLPREVRRVVTTLPGLTETVVALGARGLLVGVSLQDAEGGAFPGAEAVGAFPTIPAERVAALAPDLLLVDAVLSPTDVPRLRERFPTFACDSRTLDGLRTTFLRLGDALGRTAEAGRLAEALDRARAAARVARPVRVLLLGQAEPAPIALGPGSLLDDMLRAVGASNVAADLGRASGEYPSERVVAGAPEAILVTGGEFPAALRERWASVPAVRSGWIVDLRGEEFVRAGPRTAGALRRLAEILSLPPAAGGPR
jgi:iron complex transport system substrate-binding protein